MSERPAKAGGRLKQKKNKNGEKNKGLYKTELCVREREMPTMTEGEACDTGMPVKTKPKGRTLRKAAKKALRQAGQAERLRAGKATRPKAQMVYRPDGGHLGMSEPELTAWIEKNVKSGRPPRRGAPGNVRA